MVSVESRYTVLPSKPTPNGKLFSLIEQIKLRTHAPLLYVYKPHPDHDASTFVNTLRHSLSQALTIYYPLAGRLSSIEGGKWELHCNAKGAQLLEANCKDLNLDDLGDFVPTHLVSQLIPNIDYNVLVEDIPLLVVQLTRFPCGGVTIGVALCRCAIDGTASMRFMTTWAKLARKENLDHVEMMPCCDRNKLNSYKVDDSRSHDHSEFRTPPNWLGSLGGRDTNVVVAIVKLTDAQVKKLKHKVNYVNIINTTRASSTSRPYSTFEVVAGYLWKCVSKARYEGKSDQPTRLSTLVNCRNRITPPLPNGYAGNAAFPTVTPTCSFGEIMQKPLGYAIGNVRVALERVTREFVGSALDHIAKEKDMNLVRYNFHYPTSSVHKGPYKGNPNLFVVSWMNFSYKDADFGFGKPLYFGPGFMDAEGKAFVMNKANGDGLIVAISLEASHMDAFKKFFYGDIQEEEFPISKL
ncbi:spermidine hydroxycinnamoyl transferase-like [Glycine soja]|uniref:Spermidine hydroxycinnamoyl transferase n=1 Tax=Glycine soja TaxID=3848 RepID=A0A445GE96_GLYSO|nr:spermidine hydroxycinnamoyl transferase-like [Glycine soja]KHN46762.1 Hydroxycinnamoyl-Coenzyme A shikimate/quinate hydroxycinnamoyltransferase [Glycine soja]RZB59488.1 Spermidine hydroxycinnamoyl transferase [Glycine soja]